MKIDAANHLTDHELTVELGRLAAREREATVALIVHLGEFDARRLYEPAGFGSMFKYCRAVLHLSEGATYNRIEAARAARRHPVIVEMLTDGRLSPTTARLLARHLTAENENELLAAAAGKGRDDVEEMLADLRPRSDIRPSVRKVPAGSVQTSPAPGASIPLPQLEPPRTTAELILMSSPSSRPAAICPLGLERYEFRFMGSAALREKLRTAQDLLGHAVPSGDLAEIVDRGVTLLIEELSRRKFAATDRPRKGRRRAQESTYVPAEVRRAVWVRDGGRCAFVAHSGRRCDARRCLEFHHVVPRAAGGNATVDNIQLRCRAHNGHEVERYFGAGKRFRAGPRRETASAALEGPERRTRPGSSPRAGGERPVPEWARTPIGT